MLEIKVVDFTNAMIAIDVQKRIFDEDGTLNLLASLDRDLFMKEAGIFYPDDGVKYYLAYLDGEVVGITGLYTDPNNDFKDEMWLAWFGVLPDKQHKGYGSSILDWSMEEVKKKGKKVLRLYTDRIECANAIKLYEKAGFVGEKYNAEELSYDCYIYSKSLNNSPLELWNDKFLALGQQSAFENVDEEFIQKIYTIYKNNYFINKE